MKAADGVSSLYRLHETAEPTRPLNYSDFFQPPLAKDSELIYLSAPPNSGRLAAIFSNLGRMAASHDRFFATAPSLHVVIARYLGIVRNRYILLCWASAHRSPIRRWLFARQLGFARRILVNDSRTREELIRDWAVPEAKITWLPFGIDADYYIPAEVSRRTHLLVPGDAVRDEEFVIELARAGLGSVLRGIKDAGIRDFFAGRPDAGAVDVRWLRPFSEIRTNYQNAKAVIIPVLNDREPSGLTAMLEAMACGRPCIINEGRTTLDYIEDGVTGFILKGPRSGWLDQVREILADEDRLERVGKAARARVESHHAIGVVLPHWNRALQD